MRNVKNSQDTAQTRKAGTGKANIWSSAAEPMIWGIMLKNHFPYLDLYCLCSTALKPD